MSQLYTLVDTTTLFGTSFVKRAPLKELLLWGKVLKRKGIETKVFNLLSDRAALQYLYRNTYQHNPPEDQKAVIVQLILASNKLEPDYTSVDELKERLATTSTTPLRSEV